MLITQLTRAMALALLFAGLTGGNVATPANAAEKAAAVKSVPEFPHAISSFGAARLGDRLFVYGGHVGRAHAHSRDNHLGKFYSFDLTGGQGWQELPSSQPLQGLALVAVGDELYRIGGMNARNAPGEDSDLVSVATVERFNVARGTWEPGPSLPEGRSSHDAVAVGSKIYVVGGWQLRGKDDDSVWHETSLVLDTAEENPQWKPLPKQPFIRRALAATAAGGKLYAVGGITEFGETSREVNVFDTATNEWTAFESIPGEDRNGFGVSAYALDDKPYVSGMNGKVYTLAADGKTWTEASQLETGRFFHRLLPVGPQSFAAIGGASFGKGHLQDVEVISVSGK